MNKPLAIILLSMSFLAGCGGSGGGGGDTGGDTGGETTAAWPIGGTTIPDCVQDAFGHRLLGGVPDFHPGMDTCDDDYDDINNTNTGNIDGLPVYAIAPGTVVRVREWDPMWTADPQSCPSFCRQGNFVVIDHTGQPGFGADSVQSIYMHLAQDSLLIVEGVSVDMRTAIGNVGKTGNGINTVHLHFGLLRGIASPGLIDFDNYVNPLAYLPISAPIGYTSITESISMDTTIFDAGECAFATNVLAVTVGQQKPFYDFSAISVTEEFTGATMTLDIDNRVSVGIDGDQDDFEQGCVAVTVVNHSESSTENVFTVHFGGEWTVIDHDLEVKFANGRVETF